MIGRMAGFHRDERSATSCRYLVVRDQFSLNDGAIITGFNHAPYQPHWLVRGRWPPQSNLVISSNCTRRMICAGAFHQVISGGPVAMTVEQRPDDATAQHSRKRFLICLRLKLRDYFVALRKAANAQAFFVRRTAAK